MPHKRTKKNFQKTRLQFEVESSFLFLKVFRVTPGLITVPIETLTVLFTLKFSRISNLQICLTETKSAEEDDCENPPTFSLRADNLGLKVTTVKTRDAPLEVAMCQLPAWYLPAQRTTIGGVCSVVRYALKMAISTGEDSASLCKKLLGFQQGCLSAPAEVSTWTKFCEVDMPRTVRHLLSSAGRDEPDPVLPEDLSKLEAHLGQPVRMHNIRSLMQKSGIKNRTFVEDGAELVVSETGEKVDPISLFAMEQHVFAEGPEVLLSDILLYPSFYILGKRLGIVDNRFPLVEGWFSRVSEVGRAGAVMEEILPEEGDRPADTGWSSARPAEVPAESLYKSDPGRHNPASKLFTRQPDVERVLAWWQEAGIGTAQTGGSDGDGGLDWAGLPRAVHPQAGQLPQERLARKCHQLESVCTAAMSLARAGDVVADLCSGGGHLGLLLAHLRPDVTVHMVENKEESLARARERGLEMGMENVWFFQSNMEYYTGRFNLGVALHACGVATDLVLAACISRKAGFVCCPCCYGGVQPTATIGYPRSRLFRGGGCDESDYLVLGHAADQTMADSEKQRQGQVCMDVVDTDRAVAAEEEGYEVTLTKLTPEDCTPKNNLLIGRRATT